jgi:CubicO group peptidase (beta-lactamase class C family)
MNHAIESTLQPFVDRGDLAGAVAMVANRDRVLDVTCVGFADVANGRPMSPDTMFWIASTTKPMTATAFFMLVDEGKVSTDDPVEKFLPEFRDMWYIDEQADDRRVIKKASRPITLHDLLTHTSGLAFLSKCEPVIDARPLRETVVAAASEPLQADTGTRYIYSNAGTNTIGRVIEVVSGMPYEQFLQARLFDPLGMSDTTFFPSAAQLDRLAKVYKTSQGGTGLEQASHDQYLSLFATTPRYAAPGGGLFSTAADVTRFAQMILRGGTVEGTPLVSRHSVRRMTSVQCRLAQDGATIQSGYHFATTSPFTAQGPSPAGTCGHGGAFGNSMTINPDADLTLVWMVQRTGTPNQGPSALQLFEQKAIEIYGPGSGE